MANANHIPTHQVYSIRERKERKSVWTEVGIGWLNSDGSLNLVLNLVPLDGKLHVRVITAKDEPKAAE